MDTIYLVMGAVCLAEGAALFTGNDFLMFTGTTRKADFDLKKVYGAERWLFLVDAVCSFGVGCNRFSDMVEGILIAVFAATLAGHVYVFKSRKFRKDKKR